MQRDRRIQALAVFGTSLFFVIGAAIAQGGSYNTVEELGEALFSDTNLSLNRTQSCATCHSPDAGFADPRDNGFPHPVARAVSLGDDGLSIGDRNAPTASYARFSPPFHLRDDGEYIGGHFWDGRAADLEGQAAGPPLNPAEMGMRSKADVADRIRENEDYIAAFKAHFGETVFNDPDETYDAMTQAIAAFERTDLFAPFDSRYDRYLRGEETFTDEEELGRILFFSAQFANCSQCHQLQAIPGVEGETFTSYEYHNIGTPVNIEVRKANGGEGSADLGLLANGAVNDPAHAGKFKVPTLRNVAVTGPYMHNGVFSDLRTVVAFYNQYNTKADSAKINPETGQPWGRTEFEKTISLEELTHGPALEERRIDALVAFLKTLTDARYEHLIETSDE
ncbi:MAG: cytochrome c peroxidase [Pseudomonadota bacterium]